MPDGSLEPVRCGASNRCDYCAMFAALEAAIVLKLDAELRQPTVGLTTTTRRPDFTLDELRRAEEYLWRALRRGYAVGARRRRRTATHEPFSDLQYCGFVEWTTGEGTRAGGHRRPHVHHLVKGVPVDHPLLEPKEVYDDRGDVRVTTRLEQRVSELWRSFTGDAFVVECRPLRTPAGAIAYLALHHHKQRQAPPPGFTGRRLRPSKGYYEMPIAELRELARRLAAHERVLIAVKRAIAAELYHEEQAEIEADEALTAALVHGLRDLHTNPLELQLDFAGDVDHERERQELVARAVAELERIRRQSPPELVRVRERELVDVATGTVRAIAVAVLGPVHERPAA